MSLSTWPCLNVLKDLSPDQCKGKTCNGCDGTKIYARVLLYGQPYNCTTLEGSPPDPRVNEEKVEYQQSLIFNSWFERLW